MPLKKINLYQLELLMAHCDHMPKGPREEAAEFSELIFCQPYM